MKDLMLFIFTLAKKKEDKSCFCLEKEKRSLSNHKETEEAVKFYAALFTCHIVKDLHEKILTDGYYCFTLDEHTVKQLISVLPEKAQHLHFLSEKY